MYKRLGIALLLTVVAVISVLAIARHDVGLWKPEPVTTVTPEPPALGPASVVADDLLHEAICQDLDLDEYITSVLFHIMVGTGTTIEQATDILIDAVDEDCPRNWYKLEIYAGGTYL